MPDARRAAPVSVILLRGVMPTGRNKVPMAQLRETLSAAGLQDVRTYIQSGNAVVASALAPRALERLVHEAILRGIGADITVMARTARQFKRILADDPFADDDTARRYFTLLGSRPAPVRLKAFLAADHAPERVQVSGDTIYTLCATCYRDSTVDNATIERALGVRATTRNYNTMTALAGMLGTPDGGRA